LLLIPFSLLLTAVFLWRVTGTSGGEWPSASSERYHSSVDQPAEIIAPDADSRAGGGASDARPSWPAGLETAVGSVFATLLILGGGIAGASLASETRKHGIWDTALFSAGLLGWILLDFPYLARLHLERRRPKPEALVTLAISQQRLPPAFRPLVAIWWLSHFAFACGFVMLQEYLAVGGMRTPDRIVVTVFASVLSFGGSHAGGKHPRCRDFGYNSIQ
jgi:hypothetical protein